MLLRRLALTVLVAALACACHRRADNGQAPAPPAAPAGPLQPVSPPQPPPLTGFTHAAGMDFQGYYIPDGIVKAGNFKLTNLTIGAASDFSQWEAGQRMATYGPVLIEFEDLTSPTQTDLTSGQVHSATVRVLPDSYRLDARGVGFRGHAAGLGEVAFEGTFSPKTLEAAKAGGGGEAIVMRGTLRIGASEFRNVAFTYFAGD